MGSTRLVEGEGHHFGVAPSVEQTLLVVGEEASTVVNMMAFLCCKVQEGIQGDWGKGGLLGGMMLGVDGMVGMRVASEPSP